MSGSTPAVRAGLQADNGEAAVARITSLTKANEIDSEDDDGGSSNRLLVPAETETRLVRVATSMDSGRAIIINAEPGGIPPGLGGVISPVFPGDSRNSNDEEGEPR